VQVKTKNMVVGALVVLFVGLLWFQFVYSPMSSKASKARHASHEADVTAANLRRTIDQANAAAKNAKKHDPATDLMLAAVPIDAAEASFLRSVDALRVTSGAAWQSITPSTPTSSGTMSTITIGISVQGTQNQLLAYAGGLGRLKRLFVLDNVSIGDGGSVAAPGSTSRPAAGSTFSGGQLQMQITGRIFGQLGVVAPAGGTAGSAGGTTPVAGAPAPTGGTQNG
jgi:Tfp pilus assembly protein PilO